jgi:hypothetical protein
MYLQYPHWVAVSLLNSFMPRELSSCRVHFGIGLEFCPDATCLERPILGHEPTAIKSCLINDNSHYSNDWTAQ